MIKSRFFILLFLSTMTIMAAQKPIDYPVYDGKDLGLTYTTQLSTIKIWSPTARKVVLRFYKKPLPTPNNTDLIQTTDMVKANNGTWIYAAKGNRKGQYYTLQVTTNDDITHNEVPDIYAKAVGTNGIRAQIVDLSKTNPVNWEKDESPILKQKTDAIIYELHVRDASISLNSGMKNKGKFIALTEKNTSYKDGARNVSTGLRHLKELGITHVQLLPIYDYYTVDESKIGSPTYKKYNWGYDPLNYNAPEGSYSTNPADGATRIKELKKLIQTFHENGIRVVMDVVYNHTMFGEESYFNQIVPHYYHRFTTDNKWSNGSGCGNETASQQPMMRKFMLESLKHWVEEYHIDGFRFDLMALHDIETMNIISKELHTLKPSIILLGEGWTGGDTPLEESKKAAKKYVYQLDKIAAFSDDIRDAIKGSVFDSKDKGFVSGKTGMEESIKFGIVAATQHDGVDYNKVNYSKERWAAQPFQSINYAECHDNHTLWDRLTNSNGDDNEQTRIKMFLLAQTIVLTAQGIPFLHAGGDFLRTKQGVENSYNSSDSINELDWSRKAKYSAVHNAVRNLIILRKTHPVFRLNSTELIQKNLTFIEPKTIKNTGEKHIDNVVIYTLNGQSVNDTWKRVLVIYNGNKADIELQIPEGQWKLAFKDHNFIENAVKMPSNTLKVEGISAVILAEY